MGGSVSLPPANGLGLLVTLPVRERIADGTELILLYAAGNTRTKSASQLWFKKILRAATRSRRELRARCRRNLL